MTAALCRGGQAIVIETRDDELVVRYEDALSEVAA
jgi:hypothetical protein